MLGQTILRFLFRFLIILGLSIAVVWLISEIGIRMQDESAVRAPKTVELVIPDGTAARVAAGENPPEIPAEMSFVLGDLLVLRNEDSVAHTLGPLYAPAKSSASMTLNEADHFALACSFNTTQYLGLNVRPPTTLRTRLLGIAFAAPPTAAILFVYSLIVFPVKPVVAESPAGKSSS
jgi:hypothetical protein